jgi:hypothetical protein
VIRSEHGAGAHRPADVFAAAAAGMVTDDDVIDTVTRLILGCVDAVDADGAGVVVTRPDRGTLELLAASSHRAEEFELFQVQTDTGPCVETCRSGTAIVVTRRAELDERWPTLRKAFRSAGFASLHATPLRWHGEILGALNVFWAADRDTHDQAALLQGFADVATIAIVHAGRVSHTQVVESTREALARRHVVEQAKGVLAYQHALDMEAAYASLLELAERNGRPLSATAEQVVSDAAAGLRAGDVGENGEDIAEDIAEDVG